MRTFRQKLLEWVSNEMSTPNLEVRDINLLNQFKDKIIEFEGIEKDIVNHAYDKGYYDSELKKGRTSSYYQINYEFNDYIKKTVKNKTFSDDF